VLVFVTFNEDTTFLVASSIHSVVLTAIAFNSTGTLTGTAQKFLIACSSYFLINVFQAQPLVFCSHTVCISFCLTELTGLNILSTIPICSARVLGLLLHSTREDATKSSTIVFNSLYNPLSFANCVHNLVSIISSIFVLIKFTQSDNALYCFVPASPPLYNLVTSLA
jgi:hypothetical protein